MPPKKSAVASGQETSACDVPREGGDLTFVRQAFRETEERLDRLDAMSPAEREEFMQPRGELAKALWIRNRLLVTSEDLAVGWARPVDDIEQLIAAGELLAVHILKRRWHPIAFLKLSPDDVMAVCRKLTCMDVVAAIAFLLRKHPLLAGTTPLESLAEGKRDAVLDLTHAFAIDYMGEPLDESPDGVSIP